MRSKSVMFNGFDELFDLKNDIGESNNLAYEFPDKVGELDLLLEDWKKEVNVQ